MAYNPDGVAIYSVGLLGGSIGAGLKESGYRGRIIGISSEKSIRTALSLGCIDEGYTYDRVNDIVTRVECVFLCSPISVILRTLETLGGFSLPQGLLITDVGSTKENIVSCAQRSLPPAVDFIGGHPMAGSEKSGVAALDPFLFQNATYILTPSKRCPVERSAAFAGFLEHFLGCHCIVMNPADHDRAVAAMSHVPHILAVALVNLAHRVEKLRPGTLKLGAGGFRDMTRVASAPFSLWSDILATNKDAIQSVMGDYIALLEEMKPAIGDQSLRNAFEGAARTRSEMPAANKGYTRPQCDIIVLAKDHPGMIAELSSILAAEKINIKDIEVLKVREGDAGSIRIAFESRSIAQLAVSILIDRGFMARERN
jgi:prephenate dehydrogenase